MRCFTKFETCGCCNLISPLHRSSGVDTRVSLCFVNMQVRDGARGKGATLFPGPDTSFHRRADCTKTCTVLGHLASPFFPCRFSGSFVIVLAARCYAYQSLSRDFFALLPVHTFPRMPRVRRTTTRVYDGHLPVLRP